MSTQFYIGVAVGTFIVAPLLVMAFIAVIGWIFDGTGI